VTPARFREHSRMPVVVVRRQPPTCISDIDTHLEIGVEEIRRDLPTQSKKSELLLREALAIKREITAGLEKLLEEVE